ncbi:MAG TPA: hypothetical protein PK360_12760 [bacterium]|nr:hypothetical protein [bacterium]
MMKFSDEEIRAAIELKQKGLNWEPQVGHYVWDEAGLIDTPSPFQEKVHLIHDQEHFSRRSERLAMLQASLVWLPTWHDARALLNQMGISNETIIHRLRSEKAIEHGKELLTLYKIIDEHL